MLITSSHYNKNTDKNQSLKVNIFKTEKFYIP